MDMIFIALAGLNEEETKAAKSIQMNLMHIQIGAAGFADTFGLYLHLRGLKHQGMDSRLNSYWRKIAARNGAIEAYGTWMAMQAVNEARIPTLLHKVNMEKRKEATKLFTSEFPTVIQLRQTTAHPGELSSTEAEIETHSLKKPIETSQMSIGSGNFIADVMESSDTGVIFNASFKGNHVQYELSEAKAIVLQNVSQLYCQAYRPLG